MTLEDAVDLVYSAIPLGKEVLKPIHKKIVNSIVATYNFIDSNSKKPTVQDLRNKKVKRITDDERHTILSNEFVERHNPNTIRQAKDFKNTTDTLLGDKHIKLSNIKQFYGIENGKVKVGNINQFNDTTTVVPVRNKNYGKITKIIKGVKKVPNYDDIIDAKFPKKPYLIFNGKEVKEQNDRRTAYRNHLVKNNVIPNKYNKQYTLLGITENGDTIKADNYPRGLRGKVLFTDEQGNAVFANKLIDNENNINNIQISKLNKILQQTPLYPVLLDNGRYEHYLNNSTRHQYANPLDNPDNMYILGY